MDFAVLLHPEVVIIAIVLALVGALLGFALGRGLQAKRGEEALASANRNHARSLADLEADNSDTLWRTREGHAEEIKRLKSEHARSLESAREEQAAESARINADHAALVDRLNEANNVNIRELRAEHGTAETALREQHAAEVRAVRDETERTLQMFREEQARSTEALRSEHQSSLQSLRDDHGQATAALKRQQEEMRERLENEHQRKLEELRVRVAEQDAAGEHLRTENRTLQGTIRELNDSIKEAKRNNTFSLSKSGERLIRVIRSVQDLAQELDETSRAVSDGEYSFFDAIKDQRDRETVMKLTGGERPVVNDQEMPERPSIDPDDSEGREAGKKG